ncbi:MAG: UDP-N-acetylglucosamine 1-carboxyvinyltransferase [Desulfobacteraceae bacterium]|nr:UDP-N-acetylglucosamine 1-carboxyvinyltransferase [Desulfobacteraceae bacterium]
MDKIVIESGISLNGKVRVSGAKNAALPAIAACLLTGGWHRINNIPHLRDVETIKSIMSKLGVIFRDGGETLEVKTDSLMGYEAPYDLVKTMRASILLLGPLLARCGKAKISLPGGCAIGARPVNFHLKALSAMGVEMNLDHGYVTAHTEQLRGADIFFDIPTVTGTENIMMAAVTASGQTVLRNAAKEPEIQDLAQMLRGMGADIEGDGTDTIVIRGVRNLRPVQHTIIPDRIEAGTFMIAAAITGGEVKIEGCCPEHLEAVIKKVESTGTTVKIFDDGLLVKGPDVIESVDIKTMPFPGFPTDLQAQFMALMCVADGWSMIRENVFENRFIHVSELRRLGAEIEINGGQALVRGKKHLLSAPVMATDLRASASLVLAGLVAEGGRTEVHRIYHLDRGYEALEKKFKQLGASIWREKG